MLTFPPTDGKSHYQRWSTVQQCPIGPNKTITGKAEFLLFQKYAHASDPLIGPEVFLDPVGTFVAVSSEIPLLLTLVATICKMSLLKLSNLSCNRVCFANATMLRKRCESMR